MGFVVGVHELAAAALAILLGAGADLQTPPGGAPLVVVSVGSVVPGGVGALSLTLLETPAVGFPLSIRIDQSVLVLRDRRLSWGDVVDPLARQPRLSAPFVAPTRPGNVVVTGLVSYVTCDAARCHPRRAHVRWLVEVTAPPTAKTDGASG